MNKSSYIILLVSISLQISIFASKPLKAEISKDMFFSYPELQNLAKAYEISNEMADKLDRVFHMPLSGQTNYNAQSALYKDPKTGRKHFRVTHWNIERGYKLEQLNQALNYTESYLKGNDIDLNHPIDNELFLADVKMLKESHVYSLNEADFGMQRTDYINTVKRFAEITQSKYYTFIPEFVEIDKKYLENPQLDKSRVKAYHGNAIVSKFPIVSSKVIQLPDCYDWYTGEHKRVTRLEKIKRRSSRVIFDIPIITEVRRGHRNALVTRINIPDSDEDLTIVTTHFENRCRPKCRKKQLKYLLNELKDIDTPLILSGDFNNSEVSAEPTSITSVAYRSVTDWQNLARAAGSWFNPISYIVNPSLVAFNVLRKSHDPTVIGIPVVLRNKSADLFWKLGNFEFNDGNMFDFSDKKELSYKGKDGKLANSNQRVTKGFASTFRLIDELLITHFRFDWIFVKPLRINGCQDDEDDFEDIRSECKRFIPAFGRNLRELNLSYKSNSKDQSENHTDRDFALVQFSDHDPITCKILL